MPRRCKYCDVYRFDLPSHLSSQHPNEPVVVLAYKQSNRLIKNRLIAKIRNEGIEKTNKDECLKQNPKFERKRRRTGTADETKKKYKSVMCSVCKTCFVI